MVNIIFFTTFYLFHLDILASMQFQSPCNLDSNNTDEEKSKTKRSTDSKEVFFFVYLDNTYYKLKMYLMYCTIHCQMYFMFQKVLA